MGPKRKGGRSGKPYHKSTSSTSSSSSAGNDEQHHVDKVENETVFPESNLILEQVTKHIDLLRTELSVKIDKTKDQIINELRSENDSLKSKIKDQNNRIILLEKDILSVQQYVRRNNIEICGIPDEVSNDDLQQKVIDIASVINVKIGKKDIEACHRLKKGQNDNSARTIVRFINRQNCDKLHQNKKHLKSNDSKEKLSNLGIRGKIFFNCNLAPYSRFLWSRCKKIFNESLIDRFWVYNGTVFVSVDEKDGKGKKIEHMSDLQEMFPGYDFDSKFSS